MSDEAHSTNTQSEENAAGSEALLRETLKRCSAETIDAALAFRASRDVKWVPTIVLGIVERFLDPEVVDTLRKGDDSVRFMEDLGLDSLTMIEAIMMVEESLGVSIKNEELIDLRTIGDLKRFIGEKVQGVTPAEVAKQFPIEEIAAVMPQQDPFLFLETATIEGETATGTYTISGREDFLKGHFKNDPVFPASILLEALGQLAVFLVVKGEGYAGSLYFTGADGVRCHRVCRPGDVLELSVSLKKKREPLVTFSGRIMVAGEKAVVAEEITLVAAEVG